MFAVIRSITSSSLTPSSFAAYKHLAARTISSSPIRRETFTIQDEEDFQKRVLQNTGLDAAIAATGGKVHLAIVDIDELSDLALDVGIEAVPTVVAYKNGQPVDKFVGLIDEDRLDSFVQKLCVE